MIAIPHKFFYTAVLAPASRAVPIAPKAASARIEGPAGRGFDLQEGSISNGIDPVLARALLARVGAVPLLLVLALTMLLPGFVTLPPMDRDEPRFAQASKQMLETSDFVDIRFGDEARNKKPVGIHWLQAASVRMAELADVPDARQRIWLYRLPSLIGAILSVLLTYWAAIPLVDRRGAFLAAAMMAATPLLGVEGRLATTDAVLTATVTAAMGALVRVALADAASRGRMIGVAAVFWVSIGIGILIKGPITPLIPALAAIILSVRQGSARWLGALRPLPGLALAVLIALPWFVLILLRTHGAFFTDAVGHDLLGKVATAQESHGAPPGFYFAAFWVTAWPLAPFLALAAPALWRNRRDDRVAVLLAWAIPFWLVLEVVPTKLVHYALPLYPALAMLAVLGLQRAVTAGRLYRDGATWSVFAALALLPVSVLVLVVMGQGRLWRLDVAGMGVAATALGASLALGWRARGSLAIGRPAAAWLLAVSAALPIYLFVYGWLLSPAVATGLSVSPRLAEQAAVSLGQGCPDPLYATVGTREPSLMFATNGRLLMTDPSGAARFLADGPCRVAFVEAREGQAFTTALDPAVDVKRTAKVEGVAINGGRKLDIDVYTRR